MVPALPRGLKRQTLINESRFQSLMRDIRNDVVRNTQNAKSLDVWVSKLSPIVVNNALTTGKYASEAQSLIKDIVKASSYSPLPKGGQMELVKGVISENTMHYVTKVGEDVKTELRKIAVQGYQDKLAPKDLAKQMSSKIDGMSNSRAKMIARTETMRASNLSSYTNAMMNRGAQSFIVAGASDRCPLCSETYDNVTFTIDQNDMIPPLHPNCRCFPQFSRDTVESMDLSQPVGSESGLIGASASMAYASHGHVHNAMAYSAKVYNAMDYEFIKPSTLMDKIIDEIVMMC